MCLDLGLINILLVLLHHLPLVLLDFLSTMARLLKNLHDTTNKIKNAIRYILMIICWIKYHGEIDTLEALDPTQYVRHRSQQYKEGKYQQLDDIKRSDCQSWFGLSLHLLRQLYVSWRSPDNLTTSVCQRRRSITRTHSFSHKDTLLPRGDVFPHLRVLSNEGVPFTAMARHTIRGNPRHLSWMLDLIDDYLYFTFHDKISGASLSQWTHH